MSKTGEVKLGQKKGIRTTWTIVTAKISNGKFQAFNAKNESVFDCVVAEVDVSKGKDGKDATFVVNKNGKKTSFKVASEADQEEWIAAFQAPAPAEAPAPSTEPALGPGTIKGLHDLELIKVLGRGGYGKVQLVRLKATGEIFAMKSMSKSEIADQDLIQRTIVEKNLLLTNNHPFVIGAKHSFQTRTHIFLLMECAIGGELYGRLSEERRIPMSRTRMYVAQIASALGYLHKKNVIHRDLKPENILFDEHGYIKLTDFGLVKSDIKFDERTNTFCGTPDYIAPEMIQGTPYNASVDWWSLGCLAYEMLFGIPPFYRNDGNANAVYRAILREDIVFPASIPIDANAKDFIESLLTKAPEARLGSSGDFDEVKNHPFLIDIDWEKLEAKQIPMEWFPPILDKYDVSQFDEAFTGEAVKVTWQDASVISPSVQDKFDGFSMTSGNDAFF